MSDYKECLSDKDIVKYEYHLSVLKDIVLRNLEDANICIGDGFYTLFAQDAKKAGYDIISVSKAYFDGYYDVFLKKHSKEASNWEQVRIQAAIAAMQGLLSNEKQVHIKVSEAAYMSVLYADSLVKELKGE